MELSVIIETQKIINEIKEITSQDNNKYYRDILEFLNMIFNDNSNSILQLKIKKITLNKDIFLKYNYLNEKYKLKKKYIDVKNFDIDDINNFNDVIKIMLIMVNNLLLKLNYKIYETIVNGNKKLRIITLI